MKHRTGAVALLCLLGGAAASAPQEAPARAKPSGAGIIDGAVRSIKGYSLAAQTPVADDGEFLRRVMLDLVGYPPNREQVKAFLADRSESKRAAKVDELLASGDFADYWSRLFAEVYFGNYHNVTINPGNALSRQAADRIAKDFIQWFRLKLEKDAPYTEIVNQMLDARGTDQGDPALAYKLSFYNNGEPQAVEFANGSARHLLGIRLVCARCHDALFDRWTVEDYYGLADFIYLQRVRTDGGGNNAAERVTLSYAPGKDHIIIPDNRIDSLVVHQKKTGPAKTVFMGGAEIPADSDRMKVLGQLMTSKANPQFSKALVNRVWSWLLGRGIVHPVDDFRERNFPASKSLLDGLSRDFAENKSSIKSLVRGICASDTYQRSCHSETPYPKVDFSRGTVKQLNGDQLLNSLKVATTGKPAKNPGQVLTMVASLYSAGAIWCETTSLPGNARQALLLRNNPEIMNWITSGGVVASIRNGQGTVEEKVDELFLAALSRKADPSERARYAAFVTSHPGQGYEDAYWAILNTSEFVTRH